MRMRPRRGGKARGSGRGGAGAAVGGALRSPGKPLDSEPRAFFERRFGCDFGRVRVHTGSEAAARAEALDAVAYTAGHDITFGAGRYAPSTHEGRRLLAHELAHVVQQSAAPGTEGRVSRPGEAGERAAERAADAVAAGGPAGDVRTASPVPALQRFTFDEDCTRAARAKISEGHRVAENATRLVGAVLKEGIPQGLELAFDNLFGPGGRKQRERVAANFYKLHATLKQDVTYHCPPTGPLPCRPGVHAEGHDLHNVSVCEYALGKFSHQGMGRLLVHETVRRAYGDLSVSNINDTSGVCVLTKAYAEATTDANHPVPYSCFAMAVHEAHLEEQRAGARKVFETLWANALRQSHWAGKLEIASLGAELDVGVSLILTLAGARFTVSGRYWYRHPTAGDVEGEIVFGVVELGAQQEGGGVTIHFDWREGGASGRGVWRSTSAGRLAGRWGRGKSSTNGGSWTMGKA